MGDYVVIDDGEGLAAAAAQIAAGHGPVAVDVERASGFRYSQRAYLIQVFRRGAHVRSGSPEGRRCHRGTLVSHADRLE